MQSSYSFSALKNLEYLFLSDLGFRVTNVSMIYGFVFQNLRFMTLEGYPKVGGKVLHMDPCTCTDVVVCQPIPTYIRRPMHEI